MPPQAHTTQTIFQERPAFNYINKLSRFFFSYRYLVSLLYLLRIINELNIEIETNSLAMVLHLLKTSWMICHLGLLFSVCLIYCYQTRHYLHRKKKTLNIVIARPLRCAVAVHLCSVRVSVCYNIIKKIVLKSELWAELKIYLKQTSQQLTINIRHKCS